MNQNLTRETQAGSNYLQSFYQEGTPLRMTISSPEFLDTLCFVDDECLALPLPDDEIEIEAGASGINLKTSSSLSATCLVTTSVKNVAAL